jgi:ribulose-5-phosphate 4-epimerase/fuculose-1-phosphate aldolase
MSMDKGVDELKEQVAMSCRIIGMRGVTRGSFGHVSARIPGTDRILIKAKGPDQEALEFAEPKDIITLNLDGSTAEAPEGLEAPNESAMHLAVYRARPDVMSVIHSHPDWVVLLTAVDAPLLPIYGGYDPPGMRMADDGIPIYESAATIVDDELGREFQQVMGDNNACLLRGHGMTTAGRSVEDCTSRTLTVYELARMNYMAYAIGEPKSIPDADLAEYARRQSSGRGPNRNRASTTGQSSFWKYNKKLLARYLGGVG